MDYVVSYLSIEFGLCFILFFVLYWGLGFSLRLQNALLLAASYAILASFSLNFLYILLGYTALVYLLGLLSQRYPGRGWVNGLMLLLVLGAFYLFKYQDFFTSTVQNAFAQFGVEMSLPLLEVLLPVGLSFYAFHSVSYLVSINRRELTPGSPFDLALYLAFFPSLIAGPVNRAIPMLEQINPPQLRQVLEPQRALGLIAVAVVKLFFLSSWLANEWVDPVFDSPVAFSAEQILRAVYGYSFLIYFNFSGYTDLVTGIALLLGFRLPLNFNYPYAARNLKEFWGRWHISLSTFIRDYVYIPLGGNRGPVWRGNLNMLLAMLISGLWHGASANFIIWGALHGVGLALYKFCSPLLARGPSWIGSDLAARLLTFHYVAFAWIFFRCATLSDAMDMLSGLGGLSFAGLAGSALSLLGCLLFVAFYPRIVALLQRLFAAATSLPWLFYPVPLGLFICVVIFASPSGVPGFIYASF
ncbi:MBOAT family protein [Pseudomonas sp. MWU12-2534b]|nr:MBOAT family protein [Pseudomonas sp. MWU12-2534b]